MGYLVRPCIQLRVAQLLFFEDDRDRIRSTRYLGLKPLVDAPLRVVGYGVVPGDEPVPVRAVQVKSTVCVTVLAGTALEVPSVGSNWLFRLASIHP